MSERIVKIAIALSLLCLAASAVFYVSSINEPIEPQAVVASEKTKDARPVRQRSSFEGGFEAPLSNERGVDVASIDQKLQQALEGEYTEEEAAYDGVIAGSVFLKGKDVAFDEVTLYVVQVKSFEEPEADAEPEDEVAPEAEEDEGSEIALATADPVNFEGIGRALNGDETDVEADEGGEEAVDEGDDSYVEEEYLEPIYLDENGGFEHTVAPGEYKIIARAYGHTPVAIEGISVRAGEEVRGLVVEMEEGLKIAGVVKPSTNTEEEASLEGMEVTLEGEGYRQTRYTDALGAFEFDGLPKGTFKLAAFDTVAGSAEKLARAGETTVTLDLRFHELSGTVVDAMGVPVADVEVIGRSKYQLPAGVDRDPYGSMDGMSEPPAEDLATTEEQYAVTDESGRFTMRMASASKVALSVQLYEDGQSAFLKDVDPEARGVSLRLQAGQDLRVRVSKLPEGMSQTWIDVRPEDADSSPLYEQSQVVGLGELVLHVPAGVQWVMTHDSRATVQVVGAMPSNVKMGPPFKRGAPNKWARYEKRLIEPQVQIDEGGW